MRWKQVRRGLREPFGAAALVLSRTLTAWLPYRWLPGVARGLAVPMRLVPPVRKLILANLAVAFPEKTAAERARLFRANCTHLILTFLESLWFDRHPGRLKGLVELSPEMQEAVRRARAGPGLMFMTPHLGNWELSGQVMAAHGVPFAVVAAEVKSRFLQAMISRVRTNSGLELIPAKGAVKGIVQALRAGRSTGVLMDQNTSPRRGGIFVPFFGLPAATSRAPAALARRFGLDICPGMLIREGGQLRLFCLPMPKPTAAYASDAELTRELVALNEQMIRRHPEQYVWFYQRWRYLPAATPPALRSRFPYYAKPLDAAAEPGE